MDSSKAAAIIANLRHNKPAGTSKDITQAKSRFGMIGGQKGGPARAENLASNQRSAVSRYAALVRWKRIDPSQEPFTMPEVTK